MGWQVFGIRDIDDDDDDDDGITYTPSPEEIELACAGFRLTWSDRERIRRRRWRPGKVADATGVEASARQRLEATLQDRRQG